MNRTHILLGLLLLLGLAFAGCEDDDPDKTGGVVGTVTREPGSVAVAGAEVVLLRYEDMTVAAGPRPTNSSGEYGFAGLEPGRYYALAFSAPDLILDQTSSTLRIEAARVARHDVRLLDSQLWEGAGLRLEGTVIDADTEEPIAGAFASFQFSSLFTIQGLVTPNDAISDASGQFVFLELPVETDEGGNVLGTAPFAVTKEGYFPALVGRIDLAPDVQDTTVEYTVEMVPLGAGDGHAVTGTVLDPDEAPVANVRVHLSRLPLDEFLRTKTPMLGYLAVTDAEGVFRFDNVPDGVWAAEAGADLDDGWSAYEYGREFVVSGANQDLGSLFVYPAIQPVAPEPGSTVTTSQVTLKWEAVPGADFYDVSYGFGHLLSEASTDADSLVIGATPAKVTDGVGRWIVRAFDAEESFLGETEGIVSFIVDLPDEED